jgi:DNA-binding response OmpR family regulator
MTRRMLLLEDDGLLRKQIAVFFRRLGYEVHVAQTVAAFRALAEHGRFDTFLFDLSLPDGDGLVAWQAVRASQEGARAILMTAHGGPGLAERAAQAAVDVVLPKPLDLLTLQEAAAAGVRAA